MPVCVKLHRLESLLSGDGLTAKSRGRAHVQKIQFDEFVRYNSCVWEGKTHRGSPDGASRGGAAITFTTFTDRGYYPWNRGGRGRVSRGSAHYLSRPFEFEKLVRRRATSDALRRDCVLLVGGQAEEKKKSWNPAPVYVLLVCNGDAHTFAGYCTHDVCLMCGGSM